ncbi:hypothetical protein ACPOLB_23615 [Rubrivivax sp. RP6-9]|uniref:hypothetical protein n=1 Tax=Rubrivivax sp. RP6-9 TaxID=3415750 RepID=UPI003CC51DA4
MTNVLAILIGTSGFSAAVETQAGFVEKSFENSAAGAEAFWVFAEPLIQSEGKRVKVCTVSLEEDPGAIMEWLLKEEFGPALLSRHVFLEYTAKNNESSQSAAAAARACLSAFPFIRRTQ